MNPCDNLDSSSVFPREVAPRRKHAHLKDAVEMWGQLPDVDKGYIVSELQKFANEMPTRISRQEQKFLDAYNGQPTLRFGNAYNVFVHRYRQDYRGDNKHFVTAVTTAWKLATPEEKAECQKVADFAKQELKRSRCETQETRSRSIEANLEIHFGQVE